MSILPRRPPLGSKQVTLSSYHRPPPLKKSIIKTSNMRTIGIPIRIENSSGYDVVPRSAEIPRDLFVPIQNFFKTPPSEGVLVQANVGDELTEQALLSKTASAIWNKVCPKDGFEVKGEQMCDSRSYEFAALCYFLIFETLEERCELHADNNEFSFPIKIEHLAYYFKFRVKKSNIDPEATLTAIHAEPLPIAVPPVPRQPHHKFDLHHLYLLAIASGKAAKHA